MVKNQSFGLLPTSKPPSLVFRSSHIGGGRLLIDGRIVCTIELVSTRRSYLCQGFLEIFFCSISKLICYCYVMLCLIAWFPVPHMKVVLLSLTHFRMSDATIMSESQYCESSPVATHHYFWAGSKQAPNFGWQRNVVSFTKKRKMWQEYEVGEERLLHLILM